MNECLFDKLLVPIEDDFDFNFKSSGNSTMLEFIYSRSLPWLMAMMKHLMNKRHKARKVAKKLTRRRTGGL